MTIFELSLLASASFIAGIINSIAGGGSFLTFPALVFTGVPTIAANATSAVAVFPGYLSGALGFSKELKEYPKSKFLLLITLSIMGGIGGSLLLLITPASVFSYIIPWLLGFATLLFAFGDFVAKWAKKNSNSNGFLGNLTTLIVCIYGGYFNGGLGTFIGTLITGGIFLSLFSSSEYNSKPLLISSESNKRRHEGLLLEQKRVKRNFVKKLEVRNAKFQNPIKANLEQQKIFKCILL